MRTLKGIGVSTVVALACTAMLAMTVEAAAQSEAGAQSEAAAQSAPNPETAKAPAAGCWIHIDPATGQVAPPRAGAVPRAVLTTDPAFSTSQRGLVEVPAPGGGSMVDLQGRFRSAVWGTVEPDGKVITDCVPPGRPAVEK